MIVGYARVSTDEQSLNLQIDALKAAGCEKIYSDKGVSGAVADREGLGKAMAAIGEGDTLIVWRLDRLGRSLAYLITLIESIGARKAGFKSLTDGIDTTNSTGKLVYHIMGALAEFERSLNSERTKAGMAASKRRGTRLGRPPALTPTQLEDAKVLLRTSNNVSAVARTLGVHESTLRKYLKQTG